MFSEAFLSICDLNLGQNHPLYSYYSSIPVIDNSPSYNFCTVVLLKKYISRYYVFFVYIGIYTYL